MIKYLVLAAATVVIATSGVVQAQEPNHLQPIGPFDLVLDGLNQQVFRTLITERRPMLWMLVRSSFEYDCGLALNGIMKNDTTPTGRYELIYNVATARFTVSVDTANGYQVSRLRKNVPVIQRRAEIPDSVAWKMWDTWSIVLKGTRYAERPQVGLDGADYLFYCQEKFGMTWSPKFGIPRDLVDLGELLVKYVKQSPNRDDALLHQAMVLCDKIKSEVEKQPKQED